MGSHSCHKPAKAAPEGDHGFPYGSLWQQWPGKVQAWLLVHGLATKDPCVKYRKRKETQNSQTFQNLFQHLQTDDGIKEYTQADKHKFLSNFCLLLSETAF